MTGLKAGDVIVTDVTDDVVEGAAVQVHMAKAAAPQAAAATAGLGAAAGFGQQKSSESKP